VTFWIFRAWGRGVAKGSAAPPGTGARCGGDLQQHDSAGCERKVKVEIAEGLSAVGDTRLITIVLVNPLGNAWKYTGKTESGEISFGQREDESEQIFFVRDNGAGFDMAYAGKLFAPFQRMHRDSEFEGTGIGLATAHRIVSRHGGRMWAEAKVDAGATFSFTLGE
jgi:light-regulated signal transduction histidine kinase (bacteriophytochrome)